MRTTVSPHGAAPCSSQRARQLSRLPKPQSIVSAHRHNAPAQLSLSRIREKTSSPSRKDRLHAHEQRARQSQDASPLSEAASARLGATGHDHSSAVLYSRSNDARHPSPPPPSCRGDLHAHARRARDTTHTPAWPSDAAPRPHTTPCPTRTRSPPRACATRSPDDRRTPAAEKDRHQAHSPGGGDDSLGACRMRRWATLDLARRHLSFFIPPRLHSDRQDATPLPRLPHSPENVFAPPTTSPASQDKGEGERTYLHPHARGAIQARTCMEESMLAGAAERRRKTEGRCGGSWGRGGEGRPNEESSKRKGKKRRR